MKPGDIDVVLAQDITELADYSRNVFVAQNQHVLGDHRFEIVLVEPYDARVAFSENTAGNIADALLGRPEPAWCWYSP